MTAITRKLLIGMVVGGLLVVGSTGGNAARKPVRLAPGHPLSFADESGDGNLLTTEELGAPVPPSSHPTPVDRADTDITKVTLSRVDDGRRVLGLQVRLTLAAPAGPHVAYFFHAATPDCAHLILEYHADALGSGATFNQQCTGGFRTLDVDARSVGNDVVWTIPLRQLPASVRVGTALSTLIGYTRNNGPVLVYPDYDDATTPLRYVVGA